jgi:uncharacterized protein YifN (PemK superfamily)
MLKQRVNIPINIQVKVLYRSAKACAVCRNSTDLHFHHIDQNPSNNNEDNIIVLCTHCHGEAHTKHDLSQNLDERKLKEMKRSWELEVEEKSKQAMTDNHGSSMVNWAYFNFDQLPKYICNSGIEYKDRYYDYLIDHKIIDEDAQVIVSDDRNEDVQYRNIFKVLSFNNSHYLKQYYENMTNEIIRKVNPYELDAMWTKTEIKALLKVNDLIFFMNGLFFKKISTENKVETRRVYLKAKNIKIVGYIYTNYMFGASSYCDSFIGHKIAAGLYFIKSINRELNSLVIHVTPLALGSGTYDYRSKTPYILRKKIG